jgi:ribosomal protein S6--L-glutamate ligase
LVVGGQPVCAAELAPSTGDFRANFHLGADIRARDLPAKLAQIAVNAAAVSGCAIAGVDLVIDGQDGPFVVEVNYAPGFRGMEAATGLDIAGRMVAFAIRHHHQLTTGPAE